MSLISKIIFSLSSNYKGNYKKILDKKSHFGFINSFVKIR